MSAGAPGYRLSSFPKLFELVDASEDEIAGLSTADFDAVNELC